MKKVEKKCEKAISQSSTSVRAQKAATKSMKKGSKKGILIGSKRKQMEVPIEEEYVVLVESSKSRRERAGEGSVVEGPGATSRSTKQKKTTKPLTRAERHAILIT
ncbi:hypothetical protein HAX54_004993 [Datura stramonium]|uniref:Uncharacterized protein n=1 Tax=Datura stramonium TaxID=4076 RepID=A0ABS8T901_DATST|nr:hypothetical protein [Datura stramonium]